MLNEEQKKILLEKAEFKCQKCNYHNPLGKNLEINKFHNQVLCTVCNNFAPINVESFQKYIEKKIDWNALEDFRSFWAGKRDNLKIGMQETAKRGKIISRPAFGYKIENKQLIPAENADEVREIFEEFLKDSSLNQIAKLHKMSVNGIKKILRNFTYIGKVKFNNQILQGNHHSIISPELFNEVQKKFEK